MAETQIGILDTIDDLVGNSLLVQRALDPELGMPKKTARLVVSISRRMRGTDSTILIMGPVTEVVA